MIFDFSLLRLSNGDKWRYIERGLRVNLIFGKRDLKLDLTLPCSCIETKSLNRSLKQ